MKTLYGKFPTDRLTEIVRRGTIKEYVAAAKAVLKERCQSGSISSSLKADA
jgi:hypothetical protein